MNETMTVGETTTDEQIIELMKQSKTVKEWNETREVIKTIRDMQWIINNIDANRLITKSNIGKTIQN